MPYPVNISNSFTTRLRYSLAALFFLLLTIGSTNATIKYIDAEPNVVAIRKQLMMAINSGKTTDSLYTSLGSIKNPTSLITGYMAALQALKAKHTWNPYFKIKYLKDAEKTFQSAVTTDPHNIEIRFMRFSVEHNVPGFLGYNKNLVADKAEMIKQIDKKHYTTADNQLVKTIINFLLESKRCTASEHQNLTQHLAAL